MTKKIINNKNNNCNNGHNKKINSSSNIKKSENVTIYHSSAKHFLQFAGMLTMSFIVSAAIIVSTIINVKQDVSVLDAKLTGILLGLSNK